MADVNRQSPEQLACHLPAKGVPEGVASYLWETDSVSVGPLCTRVPSTPSCPRHLRGAPRFLQLIVGTTGSQANTICRQTYPLSNKFSPTPGLAKEDRIMSPFTMTGTEPWATDLWEGLPERMGPRLTLTRSAIRMKAQANRPVRTTGTNTQEPPIWLHPSCWPRWSVFQNCSLPN